MKKYKIEIRAQSFEFENFTEAREKVKELLNTNLWFFTLDEIKEEKEEIPPQNPGVIKVVGEKQKEKENLLKTEQKIKPIKIDIKHLKKKEIKLLEKEAKKVSTTKKKSGGGRPAGRRMFSGEIDKFIKRNWKSNTDSELKRLIENEFSESYSAEQIKGNRRNLGCASKTIGRKKEKRISESVEKNKQKRYPDEMVDFVKKNIEANSNSQIVDLINKEYDVKITYPKLAAWMAYKGLRREKKRGKPKKYTDEVMQFLKENINNFKNKGLCEELESRFNLKTDPVKLQNVLSQKKIKRDPKPGVDQEIIDFINKSKTKDAYALRDKIIEKFEKNISLTDIREIINKRPKLSGESVQEEVKRIEGQREDTEHEDSIDELDLDR